jgi:hypothetical protein
MVRSDVWSRIVLVALLALPLGGCELIGGIFKAGVWVGALGIVVVIVLAVVVAGKLRG